MSIQRLAYLRKPVDLRLCLITNRTVVKSERIFNEKVLQAVKGGVTCVQLREREEDVRHCLKAARYLKDALHAYGATLIINDRVDVALAVGADGVHLGQKDFPYAEARKILGPQAIIGLTVESWEDVRAASETDVDYLGVQVFTSKETKVDSSHLWGIEGLKKVRKHFPRRVMAIGGISLQNLNHVTHELSKGDGIAMAGELWKGDSFLVAQKVHQLFPHFEQNDFTCYAPIQKV